MNKLDDFLELLKENTGMCEKKQQKKKCHGFCIALAIIAGIAAVGAAIYAAYRYFGPSYLEDFDDDYEEDFDDDFFEDEEDEESDEEESKDKKEESENQESQE